MTEISRTQFAVAALVIAAVVIVGSHALASGPGVDTVASAPPPRTQAQPAPEPAVRVPSPPSVYVHVAGRVRRPGLYKLRAGSRIADAVRRAGGRAHGADLDAVNLAAKVTDGEQVLVPRRGGAAAAAVAPAGGTPAAPAVVSLNSASEAELETIDGIGPATAAKILAYRQEHGGFRSVDDLAQISGIGPKKLAAMRPHVRV